MFKFIALLCFVAIVSGQTTTTTTTSAPLTVCQVALNLRASVSSQIATACNNTIQNFEVQDTAVPNAQIANLTAQCDAKNITYPACSLLLTALNNSAVADENAIQGLCTALNATLYAIPACMNCSPAVAAACTGQVGTLATIINARVNVAGGNLAIADLSIYALAAAAAKLCLSTLNC